ncbi:MAG: PTS sugar transporter subunit IIA [Erysipelotrichaceae bacterium]|nr:PTS sugar transporter subunit IIA [Erysipelotrichaceae bacterium]
MNKRTIDIIKDLIGTETHSLSSLSSRYDVSVRTIRNDLKAINSFLREYGFSPVEIEKNGLIQVEENAKLCKQYLQVDDFYNYKLSKQERVAIAAILLISSTEYITISQIADDLYVSRTTIIKDLPDIRAYLNGLHLYLNSHPNKGLKVENNESSIRSALLHILVSQTEEDSLPVSSVLNHRFIDNSENSRIIQSIISEVEKEYQIAFTDESFRILFFYLNIMVKRNMKNRYIDDVSHFYGEEYRYAQDLLRYVSQYCNVRITEEEICYLANIITNTLHFSSKSNNARETIAIQVYTRALIDDVSKDLNLDLGHDYHLCENLSNHLNSIYQGSFEDDANNPVVSDIRENQKDVIDAVKKHINSIETFFQRELTEIEIIYIVIHFCAAIERYKSAKWIYYVILVCNAGIGTSQLIQAKLEKHFNLRVINIVPSREVKNLPPDSADLLVSTVPIYEAPIPFVNVTTQLKEDDLIHVGNELNKVHKEHNSMRQTPTQDINATTVMDMIRPVLYNIAPDQADELYETIRKMMRSLFSTQTEDNQNEVFSPYLHHLLQEDFIQLDVKCLDWKDAIRESARSLLSHGFIEKSYIASMIRSVEEHGPYFVLTKGVALPHAGLGDDSFKTGMGMIRLKDPVNFGVEDLDPIKYVITLSAVDQKTHLKALFHLLSLLQMEDFMEEIEHAETSKQVNRIIEKYEYTLNDY